MLSYMIPVETKQTSPTMTSATMATTQNLNLGLNLNNNEIIGKSKITTTSSVMDNSERQNSSSNFITSTKTTTSTISEKQNSVIECGLDEKINIVNEKLQHQTMTTILTDTSTPSVIADKTKLTKLNLKNAPLKR